MGEKIKTLFLMLVISFFGMSVPVFAVTEQTASDETLQSTTQAVEDDKSAGREARVKSYKEKASTKLAEAQAKRLKTRCKAAQGKVTSLRARVTSAVANRKKVYQEVGDKLDTLLAKLVAAELDTTKLETARADMKAELVTLTESLNAYDTVLTDLMAMDCEADPDTFQSALLSAREMQVALRTQASEFRSFATTELKAILKDVRSQLEAKKDQTQDTTDSSEGGN